MKRISVAFVVLTVLLSACGGDSDSTSGGQAEGKGGRIYGGTLYLSENEKVVSLYPASIVDAQSANIANQIYEGLVKFSPKDLTIQPSLAEKWEMSADGLTYTFYLKKGCLFHDNACFAEGKGREMKASDVQYSLELLCKNSPNNDQFSSTLKDRLVGATEYFSGAATSVSGVKIIDDYTLSLTLIQPYHSFLSTLAQPALSVLPKEAVEKYGSKVYVGTGPFMITNAEDLTTTESLLLVKNSQYHLEDSLGNKLPFIDTIIVRYIDSKKSELADFKANKLDLVHGLPSESIKEIVEEQIANFQSVPPKFILDRTPEMGTNYYELVLSKEVFKDKRVRQALNYAVDRNKIVEDVLKGEAYGPGEHGIIPPSFKGYENAKVVGYSYDPEKAKSLMAEAGYPNGNGFPTIKLELNSGGYKNTSVAFEVQKQLMDVLGINVELEVVPFSQKIDDEKFGRAEIFRTAWISDFPQPENFLGLFYGKNVPASVDEPSYPNISRYINPEFDALYEKALMAKTEGERNALLLEAENILMDDAPIIVLWYHENYVLMSSRLRNYYTNPMNFKNFSEVYFKTRDTKVSQRGQ